MIASQSDSFPSDMQLVSSLGGLLDGQPLATPATTSIARAGGEQDNVLIATLERQLADVRAARKRAFQSYIKQVAERLGIAGGCLADSRGAAEEISESGYGTLHEAYWLAVLHTQQREHAKAEAYARLCLDVESDLLELREEATELLLALEVVRQDPRWEPEGIQAFARSPFVAVQWPVAMLDPPPSDINALLGDLTGRYQAIDPRGSVEQRVHAIIATTAVTCGLLAVQPFPILDVFVLTPVQVLMVMQIGELMGCPIEERGARSVVMEIAAASGTGFIAQHLVIAAYKTFLPFLGTVTTVPTVAVATYGIGLAAKAYFAARLEGRKATPEELRQAWRKGEELGKSAAAKEHLSKEIARQEELRQAREAQRQSQSEAAREQARSQQLMAEMDKLRAELRQHQNALRSLESEQAQAKAAAEAMAAERERLAAELERLRSNPPATDSSDAEQDSYRQQLAQLAESLQEKNELGQRQAAEAKRLAAQVQRYRDAIDRMQAKQADATRKRWQGAFPEITATKEAIERFCALDPGDQGRVEDTLRNLVEGRVDRKAIHSGNGLWEARFSGDGRIYFRGGGSRYVLLLVGDKGTQKRDLEWLRKQGKQ